VPQRSATSATLLGVRRSIALAVAAATAAAVLAAAIVANAGPRSLSVGRGTFTGYGFDACTAPSLSALGAWLASPYRAVGVYIGGVNRACADGNLSASWVESATSGGWSLFPLYVGLQAPCVSQNDLARIDPVSAAAEGSAAADDAVSRAQFFGLEAGVPIYFDMESYATNDPSCTQAVQQFVSAWVDELHAAGYVAGVYGSAASMIRDMVPLATAGTSPPDQIDIGNWNGSATVFGDPYVPDADWAHHQRIHQYRGGHRETWGGVTINIDNDYLDGAVAGLPTPVTGGGQTPAGTVASTDGRVSASWPAGAFPQPAAVTLTPATLPQTEDGFADGSYLVQLNVTADSGGAPIAGFAGPVTLRFQPPTAGVVPAFSSDGITWTVLLHLPNQRLPKGATAGYTAKPDGTVIVTTLVPGSFGLLSDVGGPTRPNGPTATFEKGVLRLAWQPSQDNSGTIASYQITRGGNRVLTVAGISTSVAVRPPDPGDHAVFRVVALDGAGNQSTPSAALLVAHKPRPADAPRAIPAWAWQLLRWQHTGHSGAKPATPRPFPHWYWHWASWQARPYRITRYG
jgi:Domain of unknown function (DUF1906)